MATVRSCRYVLTWRRAGEFYAFRHEVTGRSVEEACRASRALVQAALGPAAEAWALEGATSPSREIGLATRIIGLLRQGISPFARLQKPPDARVAPRGGPQ